MTRYANMFARLDRAGEGAFGAFVMLGDPDPETSGHILDALVEGGADMVELGIPFSDPIADGPVIQAAAERALRREVTRPFASTCSAASGIAIRTFRSDCSPMPTSSWRGHPRFYATPPRRRVDSVLVAESFAEADPFIGAACFAVSRLS